MAWEALVHSVLPRYVAEVSPQVEVTLSQRDGDVRQAISEHYLYSASSSSAWRNLGDSAKTSKVLLHKQSWQLVHNCAVIAVQYDDETKKRKKIEEDKQRKKKYGWKKRWKSRRRTCQCEQLGDYIDTLHFLGSSSTDDFSTLTLQCVVDNCVAESLGHSEKKNKTFKVQLH